MTKGTAMKRKCLIFLRETLVIFLEIITYQQWRYMHTIKPVLSFLEKDETAKDRNIALKYEDAETGNIEV